MLDGWGQHAVAETGDSQRIGAGITGFRCVSTGLAGSAQLIALRRLAGCAGSSAGFAGRAQLIGSGFAGGRLGRHDRRAHDQDRI